MMRSMDEMQKAIAQDLGIGTLPPEEQEQAIAAFGEVALKAATLAIAEKLSPEKRDEFGRLAQGGDPAALSKFLDVEVPDHDAIAKATVAREVAAFKAASLARGGAAQAAG
jgi:hypothetical protein